MVSDDLKYLFVDFATYLLSGLLQGSIYALIALGYTMVYGVLKLINFAHSEIYMVSAFLAFLLLTKFNLPLPVVLLVTATMTGFMAVGLERFFYRPLRTSTRLAALITSLGVSLLLQNLFQIWFGPDAKNFPALAHEDTYEMGDIMISQSQLLIAAVTLALMLGLWFFIEKTAWGRAIKATSFNNDAARLMGINIDKTIALTFFIGGFLAGVAGVLVGLYQNSIDPLMGVIPGLKAFTASVIGGIGSIPGAVLGALFIGVTENLYAGFFDAATRDIAAFLVLIVLLVIKPAGLLGSNTKEKV